MAGRRRGRYPPEYKERIVELVRAGRSPGSVAREFEPSEQTIRNWVKQADLDEGLRSDGLTTEARKEMRELKRDVKRLRMERDILKKSRGLVREGERIDPWRGYAFMKGVPGHLPACGHVPGAGSLPQRVLRLAAGARPRRGRGATPNSRSGSRRSGATATRPTAARGSTRRSWPAARV